MKDSQLSGLTSSLWLMLSILIIAITRLDMIPTLFLLAACYINAAVQIVLSNIERRSEE